MTPNPEGHRSAGGGWTPLMERWREGRVGAIEVILLAVAVALLGARFIGLERSPPGFYVDEFLGALHVICLSQTGHSSSGQAWPLFAEGGAGGFYTPVLLYLGAVWVRLFGPSIYSFRALAALAGVVTVLGATALAKRAGGPRFAFWTFVLACLSPWAFQFSRIAWDPPLYPAFLVWAVYFWLGARRTALEGALSGALFAGALYSYPPARIAGPLLFAALLVGTWSRLRWRQLAGFALCAIALLLPLAVRYGDPGFRGRGASLSIFSDEFVRANRGHWPPWFFFIRSLFDNVTAHFRPSFLFLGGDQNLRHSTQYFGELGLLDAFALTMGLAVIAAVVRERIDPNYPGPPDLRSGAGPGARTLARYFGLAGVGILAGILPAALTWEAIPHALRSIGAWPFFSLLGGGLLVVAETRWPAVRPAGCAAAVLHASLMVFVYFGLYPSLAEGAFSSSLHDSFAGRSALSFGDKASLISREQPEGIRYYLIRSRKYDCTSSWQAVSAWQRGDFSQ
jgi:4-amino-4-deoxy-L-arabinose transferase-like glycosyltransferase